LEGSSRDSVDVLSRRLPGVTEKNHENLPW
jgi:hypothetical protein